MCENDLAPKQKRKRWRPATTDSNHRQPVAENWLAKVPASDRPDQVWVADITSIDTGEGWLYWAALVDACTRRCVGWQAGETLEASLVTQAWQKAVRSRRPGPGLLHHSDRGVQYASAAMAALLAEQGAAASMSRKGNCDRQRHDGELLGHAQSGVLGGRKAADAAGRQASGLRLHRGLLQPDPSPQQPRLPVSSGVRANDQLQQKLTLNENYESLVHVFEERSLPTVLKVVEEALRTAVPPATASVAGQ